MAPASEWVVDHSDDRCLVRRDFRAGDQQATLELRKTSPGDGFQVGLLSSTLSRADAKLRVRWEPDQAYDEPPVVFERVDGGARGVAFAASLRPDPPQPARGRLPDWPEADREARERGVTGLTVRAAFRQAVTLQTGSVREPMEALRTCADALLGRWGFDPATPRTLSRQVTPVGQAGWMQKILAALPPQVTRQSPSGATQVRLLVGPDGKQTACIADKELSSPAFADYACTAMMRFARFEPALDAGGKPVAGLWSTSITYRTRR